MTKRQALGCVALCLLVACQRGSSSTAHAPALRLAECDPAGYLPCIRQSALLSIPIADASLNLTYSSEWRGGPDGSEHWDSAPLGLGGWSIDLVERYDRAEHVLLEGDGSWRIAEAVSLPSGESVVPAYDGSLAYIFDAGGRHVRTVDGRMGIELVNLKYDAAGRLLSIAGFIQGQRVGVTVERDAQGRAQRLIGISGGATALTLNDDGRLVHLEDPSGSGTSISWFADGRISSKVDAHGNAVTFNYDQLGHLAVSTDEDQVAERYERKTLANGFEVSAITPLGRRSTYRVESVAEGIRRTYVAADQTTIVESVDAQGLREIRRGDGTTLSVGQRAHPSWGVAAPLLTPVTETRPDGKSSVRELTCDLKPQHSLPYVLAGSITTAINRERWVESLDPAGRTVDIADPVGRHSRFSYDANGRVLRSSMPGRADWTFGYDGDGRVDSVTVGSGQAAEVTRFSYDSASGTITLTLPDNGVRKIQVDRFGRPAAIVNGDGSTTLTSFDRLGRLFQFQSPGGMSYAIGTSAAGRFSSFVPPPVGDDASIEIVAYDADGQAATITGPGERHVTVDYDSSGRPASWNFDQGQRTITYDERSGFVSQTVDPDGITTRYGYAGRYRNQIGWTGAVAGSVVATLDENGKALRETVNGGAELSYDYDASGLLRRLGPLTLARDDEAMVIGAVLGVVETRNEFDGNRRLVHTVSSAAGRLLFDARYERDVLGRLKSVSETFGTGKKSIAEYTYDQVGRLSDVRLDGRSVEHNEYDSAGNRTATVANAGKISASYDARDRIVSWGNERFEWASDGRLQRRVAPSGITTFTYDALGSLRGVSLSDGRQLSYLLDAEGRRVGRSIGGKLISQYLYRPDGTLAAELDGAGKLIARFGLDEQGSLAALERDGTIYRVITDPRGSPRLIIDAKTGAVADEITYDPWGRLVQESSPGFSPIGFAGGLRDVDTGLVHFGARDYDPTTGRWAAADPLLLDGGDANLYAYVGGDPINRIDRSGLFLPLGPLALTGGQLAGVGLLGLSLAGGAAISVMQMVGLINAGGNLVIYLTRPSKPRSNPPGSNPPSSNPPKVNPPLDPYNWSCSGETCAPSFTDYSCALGECGMRNGHFYCHAGACWGPDNKPLCSGDEPCNWGEPHVVDSKSRHFDFQAAGEFLALASPDGKLIIEARQERLGGSSVAANTAIAANVAGDRVGIYLREKSFLLVNGKSWDSTEVEAALPQGGQLRRHGGLIDLRWPEGDQLRVQAQSGMLNYGFRPGPHSTGLRGLLGSDSDLVFGENSSAVLRMDATAYEKLYKQLAPQIRIQPAESLFDYSPGESTATFTDLNFPPAPATSAALSTAARADAERICRALGVQRQPLLDDCILDVATTGKPAVAAVSLIALEGVGAPGRVPSAQGTQAQEFAISLGDIVSTDHPAAGAGSIGTNGGKQSYPFQARAGTLINLRPTACDGQLSFDIQDPAARSLGGRTGCGELPTITLPADGTYRIIVSSDHGAARYGFTLSQTRVDEFTLHIGDAVSPDHPASGAGILNIPGQRQSYSFAAEGGDRVYINVGPCDGSPILELKDPANAAVDGHIGCDDFGPDVLKAGGTYRLEVRSDQPATKYSFALLRARFDTYTINVGDSVSPDHPAAGAGIINELGQRQAFEFVARASDTVYISLGPCEGASPVFDLLKQDGSGLGGHLGPCTEDFGRVVLPETGTYRIVTRTNPPNFRSRYSFSVTRPPADRHFAVQLPFTVADGSPAAAAGVITAPGAQQFYDFSAKPGTLVHVESHCACPRLTVRAVKAGDSTNDSYAELSGFKPDWKLPEGGQYTLQIFSHGYTGPYSLTATQLAGH